MNDPEDVKLKYVCPRYINKIKTSFLEDNGERKVYIFQLYHTLLPNSIAYKTDYGYNSLSFALRDICLLCHVHTYIMMKYLGA